MKGLKWLLPLFLLLLLSVTIASAKEIDYTLRCDIVQPATEFRAERVFEGIGIYGRFVKSAFDEELNKIVYWTEFECFAPSNVRHKEPAETTVSAPVCREECVDVTEEICEEVCEWESICRYVRCPSNWYCLQKRCCKEVCEDVCHNETHEECSTVCS